MALPVSSTYNDKTLGPHEMVTVVRVFHGSTEVTPAGGVPLVSGSVRANLSSRVTRTLDMQVPFEFFPHEPTDLLSPYQAIVRIDSGPKVPGEAAELFPVFTGRVYEASLDGDGAVTIRADDLAADALAFRFELPQSSQSSLSVVQQMQALISEAVNNATFGPNNVDDTTCPMLTWDDDRGKALDDLASALGARWYTLGDGRFVIREYPYISGNNVAAVLLDSTTANGKSVMISATKTITRDATANSITVISERTDGTSPVIRRRRDAGTGSPTQFGGPFGKVSQIIRVQTPLTTAEADTLASRQLAASLALTEQWSVQTLPLQYLEPGDAVFIRYRGVSTIQIIDSISLPLTTGSNMSFTTRTSVDTTVTES
jgi:hypothetical protein